MLTERLDHRRGMGQQSITVKYVTVNADQAMVAETITTTSVASPAGKEGVAGRADDRAQDYRGWRGLEAENEREPQAPPQRRPSVRGQVQA
jgi:hypothetical protein